MEEKNVITYEEKLMLLALRAKSMVMEMDISEQDRKEGLIVTSPDFFLVADKLASIVMMIELNTDMDL